MLIKPSWSGLVPDSSWRSSASAAFISCKPMSCSQPLFWTSGFISTFSRPCWSTSWPSVVRVSFSCGNSEPFDRRSLSTVTVTKMLVQAFISSCIDYCNSLLYGVTYELVAKLQAIQNAAAQQVTGTRKYDHISPVLQSLHWLPVRHRLTFKLAMLVYKSLHALLPPYLEEDIIPLSSLPGWRHSHSTAQHEVYVPRTRTVLGTRAFTVLLVQLSGTVFPLASADPNCLLLHSDETLKPGYLTSDTCFYCFPSAFVVSTNIAL